MKRSGRILLTAASAAAALLVGLGVLVAAFLASPIPARLAAEAIAQTTGMEAHIGSLRLGWFGRSHVSDMTLTSPHGGPALLTLDEAHVEHAPLWRLLITREPTVTSIVIDGGRIVLSPDDDGQWNAAPLWADRRGDDKPGAIDAGRLQLPAVMMRGMRVEYRPAAGEPTVFGPFTMTIEMTADGDRVTLTNDRDLQAVITVGRLIWPGGTGMEVWRGLDADVAATFSNVDLSWLMPEAPDGESPLGIYTGRASFVAADRDAATQGGQLTFELTATGSPTPTLVAGRGVIQVDLTDTARPRLVAPSTRWRLGDGEIELWGRASRPDEQWRVYASAQMSRLPIQPLLKLAGAGASAPVGRVDGQVRVTLPVGDPDRAYGDARLTLSESDLANSGLFAAIYNVFNIRLGTSQPTGRGELVARLEGRSLEVRAMRYANRGAHLRLSGRAENIYLGRASPLRGYAMGATRPLPNLPLLAKVNDVLGVLGQGVTAMSITGTLAQPKVEPMSLKQARTTVSQIIRGGKATK